MNQIMPIIENSDAEVVILGGDFNDHPLNQATRQKPLGVCRLVAKVIDAIRTFEQQTVRKAFIVRLNAMFLML